MKNKITWILTIVLFCGAVTSIEADVKRGEEQVKEEKLKNHTPGCNCGVRPPKPPKFWFWFSGK